MTHPIPPGSRDILPDEMRELRALQRLLADVFESFGYGEVATPTVEYDEVLALGDIGAGAPAAHRFFDKDGALLAMRSDSTVPIARLIADRYSQSEPPFRFFYNARAYRSVRPQRGQMGEFFQAGIELVGSDAPGGTVEVIEILSAALDAAGLGRAVIGLGQAGLYEQLLAEVGVAEDDRSRLIGQLASHDLVGLDAEIGALDVSGPARDLLIRFPKLRGGPEVIAQAKELGGEAVERSIASLEETLDGLIEKGIAERVRIDLGLLRDLGYYTGAILEIYDPAVGHILGGGGRYDELMGRFGKPLPAVGFSLYLERLHIAQAEEERIASEGAP